MDARRFGRDVCGDLAVAETREWIVTNGRGGYASGTVAGSLTRRYHGLLIAALAPPVERRLIVAKCEIDVEYDGAIYALGTNRWSSGAVVPQGYLLCESFALADGIPTWTYACGDALIEQTIAMPDGIDATAVGIRVLRARTPVTVRGRVLAADRDHHGGPLPDLAAFGSTCTEQAGTVVLPLCGRTLRVFVPGAAVRVERERYAGFAFARETERGLQDTDDYACVLSFEHTLAPGGAGGCVVSIDPSANRDPHAIIDGVRAAHRIRAAAQRTPALGELAIAADAFIVRRGDGPFGGKTIIAGYPWFGDWGRDTMIALPGLTLRTGRTDVARAILQTFAKTIDGGMLPNRFPDDGSPPEYNTVDAALWFIEAVRAYVVQTDDDAFLNDVFPALRAIVDGYGNGTRYGIRVDTDGLVRAGCPGVQLTWMDAKVGDRVITPRIGKPIEVNALWYAGLRAMELFAQRLDRKPGPYRALAEHCALGFARFWNAERGFCFDVLDGPSGNEPALRPNQLFAVSLHASPVDDTQARGIVDACSRELLTSYGLRSLAPSEPGYRGRYAGDQTARDEAYHQGTVWLWLLGPFVRAHMRVYRDPATARSFIAPLLDALDAYGIGTLGEIFDGDAPHAPRGTIAQAWSVAEAIDLFHRLEGEATFEKF